MNSFLNTVMEETVSKYDLVVIDFDAGLEHFSRRSGNPRDSLVVTCDPSKLSFDTAGRITKLITELSLPYENMYLIGSRFTPDHESFFHDLTAQTGLEVLGLIPFDCGIAEKNMAGEPLLSLPDDNPALRKAETLMAPLLEQLLK